MKTNHCARAVRWPGLSFLFVTVNSASPSPLWTCLTFRLCALKFFVQKFKRQMGILSAFFETQKRDTKGRLNRVLVIADSSVASEALVRMLESYYTKDVGQDKYLDSRLPYVHVLDTTPLTESPLAGWKSGWMEYKKIGASDQIARRVSLSCVNGKIIRTKIERDAEISLEDALKGFATDSRGEASSILWSKIILSYAKLGDFDAVLYPESATRIASKVLALTSQGRGFSMPWECGSLVKMPNGFLHRNFKVDLQAYIPRDR